MNISGGSQISKIPVLIEESALNKNPNLRSSSSQSDKKNKEIFKKKDIADYIDDFRKLDAENELLSKELADEKLSLLNNYKEILEYDKILDHIRNEQNTLKRKELFLSNTEKALHSSFMNLKNLKEKFIPQTQQFLTSRDFGSFKSLAPIILFNSETRDKEEPESDKIEKFMVTNVKLPISTSKIRDLNSSEKEFLVFMSQKEKDNPQSSWEIEEVRQLDGNRLDKENINQLPFSYLSAFAKKIESITSVNNNLQLEYIFK